MKLFRKPLILLACVLWLIPAFGYSGFIVKERISVYRLEFDLNWYQKFLNIFLNYEVLYWKEIITQELFIKTSNDIASPLNGLELILLSLTPTNFNEALYLKNAGRTDEGFVRFVGYQNLSPEGARQLLEIINYCYSAKEESKEFISLKFFENDSLNAHPLVWKITKTWSKEKYLITVEVFQKKSKNELLKIITVNITLNPLEKIMEKASVEIKNGPKFTVTKNP